MRHWIVAFVAVAFLAGGPALADCKSGGKCGGAKKSNCSSQQMSAGACGQAMKAGACGQAMKAGACGQAMKAGACGQAMKAGRCGQGPAGCASTMKPRCGQAMPGGCGSAMACGPMAACGSRNGRVMHVSQDPSNIWFRGPAPRASIADWACGGRRCGNHGAMRCPGKAGCRGMSSGCGAMSSGCGAMSSGCGAMSSGCGQGAAMNCGGKSECRTSWKAGAGMSCGTGGQSSHGRKAWKSGDDTNTVTPKGGCCAGKREKG
jgi:hypothetical protein